MSVVSLVIFCLVYGLVFQRTVLLTVCTQFVCRWDEKKKKKSKKAVGAGSSEKAVGAGSSADGSASAVKAELKAE